MTKDQVETQIIGSALINPHCGHSLLEALPDYYYGTKNKNIFIKAIKAIIKDGFKIWDWNRVLLYLPDKDKLDISNDGIAMISGATPHDMPIFIRMLKDFDNKRILGDALLKALKDLEKGDPRVIGKQVVNVINSLHVEIGEVTTSMGDLSLDIIGGKPIKKYPIDDPIFSSAVKISQKNIYLIAGKGGSFKTKYIGYIVKRLLLKYKDISVLWANLEDPSDKILRMFLSEHLKMNNDEIEEKQFLLDPVIKEKAQKLTERMSKFDISFTDKDMGIDQVEEMFEAFYKSRKKSMALLVLDNLMGLEEIIKAHDEPKALDAVVKKIDDWGVKLSEDNTSVVLMHHINQDTEKNQSYRPTERNIRGTSRMGDIPTVIILVNAIANYPHIAERYGAYSEYIKRLFIVDVSKNRNSKPIIKRYLAFPEYSTFVPLD